jgi:hypothetical protein
MNFPMHCTGCGKKMWFKPDNPGTFTGIECLRCGAWIPSPGGPVHAADSTEGRLLRIERSLDQLAVKVDILVAEVEALKR